MICNATSDSLILSGFMPIGRLLEQNANAAQNACLRRNLRQNTGKPRDLNAEKRGVQALFRTVRIGCVRKDRRLP